MTLTDTQKAKIDNLKAQGFTTKEILAHLGAEKMGSKSAVMQEYEMRSKMNDEIANKNSTWRKVVAAPAKYLAPDAVDTFGNALARRGIGTGDVSSEITRNYIDEPTAGQYAGAFLQTAGLAADVGITVGSLGAATPMTLGRNIALGAGLGYVYDVGEDLVQQESLIDTLTPGFATIVGGAAPAVFAGIGAGYRAVTTKAGATVADDAARAAAPVTRQVATEGAQQTVEQPIENTVRSGEEALRGLGQRFTRTGRRIQETIEDNAARNVLRENARPAVLNALDEGIDTSTIMRIENVDDVTKKGYQAVVNAAEGANPVYAEKISGEYAAEMYQISRNKQREIGQALGNARRSLGDEIISQNVYTPSMRTLRQSLSNNGINLKIDGTVEFRSDKFLDEEQKVISDIWGRLAKYDTITPSEIDEIAQYLSKLQYKTNVTDKIGGVYIDVVDSKTGEIAPVSIFDYIRNTYDSLLEQVDSTGNIKRLRTEYSQAKSVTGRIEDTWLNGLDLNKATNEEIADALSLALRRLDSRAKSRATYSQIYRALDKYARANGYQGADAAELSNFYVTVVEPLYKEATPPTSFQGGIFGGFRQALEGVLDVGKANVTDKQRALRGLLDLEDVKITPQVVNPAGLTDEELFAKKGIIERAADAMKDQRGSISLQDPQRPSLKRRGVSSVNYTKLSDQGQEYLRKFLNHVDGTQPLSGDELKDARYYAQLMADRNNLSPKGNESDKTIANKLADFYHGYVSNWDELKSFNQSATTKTTDLLEEARKYKSADEFVSSIERGTFRTNESNLLFRGDGSNFIDNTTPDRLREVASNQSTGQYFSKTSSRASEYGKVSAYKLQPNYRLADKDKFYEFVQEFGDNRSVFEKELQKAGFTAYTNQLGEVIVLDPTSIKKLSDSDLIQLWNQANK